MTPTIKGIHPLADLFPMMSKQELAALADDIKANGLREPIKVTTEGLIVDGRNRQAACALAKVEPVYETVNGDAGDRIISANVFRRHMTKGQIAILAVVAELGISLVDGPSEGRDGQALRGPKKYDYRLHAHKRVEGLVSARVIKTAVEIVRWAPDHALGILESGQGWKDAQLVADERAKIANSEEKRREVLAADSPELLAQVSDDGITLAEAWRLREARLKQDRERHQRLTGYLVDRVKSLLNKTDAQELVENYDPEYATKPIGIAELDEAISYLQALRSEMKRQKKG